MLFWTKVKLVAAMIALVLLTGGAVGTYVAFAQSSSAPTQIAGGGPITALTGTLRHHHPRLQGCDRHDRRQHRD